jgi:hypothetical protein
LGRDVVPEVYWTLIGAPGSGRRAGTESGSPSRPDQAVSPTWCPASPPTGSASVQASHFSCGAAAATSPLKRGWVMAPTASLSSA